MSRLKAPMALGMALSIMAAAPAVSTVAPGVGSGEACALVAAVPQSDDVDLLEECFDAVDQRWRECTEESGFIGDIACGVAWVAGTILCGMAFE